MGTKLPATVAADDQLGDELPVEHDLQEKYAWQMDRGLDYNPTADVLRYTIASENASAHSKGTSSLVSGLTGLDVWIDNFTIDYAKEYGVIAEAGDKLFVFYDTQLVQSDLISYDGKIYEIVNVFWSAESGRCEVQGRLSGRTP